mmetsp:Transcript_37463/g.86520  ORF Transcript_37463/g.86520 Transcript_37463/m.86520 type:complete len:100 (+) Transcript_37463:343-642(+)
MLLMLVFPSLSVHLQKFSPTMPSARQGISPLPAYLFCAPSQTGALAVGPLASEKEGRTVGGKVEKHRVAIAPQAPMQARKAEGAQCEPQLPEQILALQR